jgi:PLP dependent protein
VQVNTSGEGAKTGFTVDDVMEGVGAILELDGVQVEGLMTMAPFTDDRAVLRKTFATLAGVGARLAAELSGYEGRELSMGMSNDYEVAVEEGSTIVRLGTVLFGERGG